MTESLIESTLEKIYGPKAHTKIKVGTLALTLSILILLVIRFAKYVQIGSFDIVWHFLLIDEIMKYGTTRALPLPNLDAMVVYPPASHWMAAFIGWLGGSGLVGMLVVTIAAVYCSYLLIAYLAGVESLLRTVLLVIAVYVLQSTLAQVGWEVVTNFFYPQIVADVIYFAVLFWVTRQKHIPESISTFLIAGTLVMWMQPLIAVHILAAGIALIFFQIVRNFRVNGRINIRIALYLIIFIVLAGIVTLFHPAFRTMRTIALNDGSLEFGFKQINLVAVACLAIGLFNLWRCIFKVKDSELSRVDFVVSSALVAAVGLELGQFAALKLFGAGSFYAVKKHMFLIVTLGVINAVRLLSVYLPSSFNRPILPAGMVAPLVAAGAVFLVLHEYKNPVEPVVRALSYAEHTAKYEFIDFKPSNTYFADPKLPAFGNALITQAAFQLPFSPDVGAWWGKGTPLGMTLPGLKYVMTSKDSMLNATCDKRLMENGRYVVTETACVNGYKLGRPLRFEAGGNGWQFAEKGWGLAEPWGAWVLGPVGGEIHIKLNSNDKGPFQISVDGGMFIAPQHTKQIVTIEVNGTDIETWTFDAESPQGIRKAVIPVELVKNGKLDIRFKTPGAVSPADLIRESSDTRVLGLSMKSVTISSLSK